MKTKNLSRLNFVQGPSTADWCQYNNYIVEFY